jgi:hypothetical protein
MYMIAPNMDTESLLAQACESLASASVLASDFATHLIGATAQYSVGDSTDHHVGGAGGESGVG